MYSHCVSAKLAVPVPICTYVLWHRGAKMMS